MSTRDSHHSRASRHVLSISICQLLLAVQLSAVDWPQFRGPDGNGVSSETGLPSTWSAESNRVWKVELPGSGGSQPVTSNGRIYVTSYSGYAEDRHASKRDPSQDPEQVRLHVLCLDATDGSEIWRQDLTPLHAIHPNVSPVSKHGYATSTPVIDGDALYTSFGVAGVFALDLRDGSERWRISIGDIAHRWGDAASLAVCDDLLLLNASTTASTFIAVDKHTGDERWRNDEGMVTNSAYDRSWASPLVLSDGHGGKQIVQLNLQELCAYDPATGATLWTFPTRQGYSASTPIWHDNIIYAITGSGHGQWNSWALKLDKDLDKNARTIWHNDDNGTGYSSAVYVDGYIYYAAFSRKERPNSARGFCCLDASSGEVVYKVDPEYMDEDRRLRLYCPAFAGDGKIYYITQENGIYVVAAKPEFELLAHNVLDDDHTVHNAPLLPLGDGRLLLRTDWGLHCLADQ